MPVVRELRLRELRSYERARVALGERLTVVHGANGSGKTNLLEALYFGLTARSCRTANDRELLRFGARAARVEVEVRAPDGAHVLAVGYEPGAPKRMSADGAPVERLLDVPFRPLVSVFLPDRLELVKGAPALRRAHVDRLVAGLWPARGEHRRGYARALAQRNALLARIGRGGQGREALGTWDLELGRHALALREARAAAIALVAPGVARLARELGLAGEVELRHRPRSHAPTPDAFAAELAERLAGDLERGFTAHGPHRDEVELRRDGRELRVYGSQGEQRLALLALLIAEREALERERGTPPLLLLDDVMSELDADRRDLLIARVAGRGQVLVTTTDTGQVPIGPSVEAAFAAVDRGVVLPAARAA